MKKLLVGIAAAALVFGAAGHAKAYFSADDELFQVIYEGNGSANLGTNEIVVDLGKISSLFTAGGVTTTNSAFATDLSTYFGNTSVSNLQVGYFAEHGAGTNATHVIYTSGTTAPTGITGGNFASASGAIGSFRSTYSAASVVTGTDSAGLTYATTVGSTGSSNLNGYWQGLDAAGLGIGTLAGYLPNGGSQGMEVAMVAGGQVAQNFYEFKTAGTNPVLSNLGTITTLSNGTVITQAAPVPIPPSVLLFGSGLLGLISIRRRSA